MKRTHHLKNHGPLTEYEPRWRWWVTIGLNMLAWACCGALIWAVVVGLVIGAGVLG